jgi:hypothetical protein
MTSIQQLSLVAASLLLVCTHSHADNCDAIKSEIDAKIRASSVASFTLNIVDVGTEAKGKTVGSCAQGQKKIMYAVEGSTTKTGAGTGLGAVTVPATARPRVKKEAILTECRDGTESVGGDCEN